MIGIRCTEAQAVLMESLKLDQDLGVNVRRVMWLCPTDVTQILSALPKEGRVAVNLRKKLQVLEFVKERQ